MGITFNGMNYPAISNPSVDLSKSAVPAGMKEFIGAVVRELGNLGGIVTPDAVRSYARDVKHELPIGAGIDAYIEGKIRKINGEKVRNE